MASREGSGDWADAYLTERRFQATVERAATLLGWRYYHTYDSRRSPEGFPDLVLVKGPRLIFAELKKNAGRVSKSQELWLGDLRDVQEPPEVYLWRPREWTHIEQVLRGQL